jgi:hypothetical protein
MITFPSLNASQSKLDRILRYTAFRNFIGQGSSPELNPSSATYSIGPNIIIDRDSNVTSATRTTYFNSQGVITQITSLNAPRFEYDPVNVGTPKGLLIEDGRNNYLLGCAIDGTHPSYTTATTVNLDANTTYTLSFYTTTSRTQAASATVELSGIISSVASGAAVPTATGSLPTTNATIAFTATSKLFGDKASFIFTVGQATSITIRITAGAIFFPQIENKSNATSFIVTSNASSPTNRSNEKVYFGTGVDQYDSGFYRQGPGTVYVEIQRVNYNGALNWWNPVGDTTTTPPTPKVNTPQSTFFGAKNADDLSFIYLQTLSTNNRRSKFLTRVNGANPTNSNNTIELSNPNTSTSGVVSKLAVAYSDIAGRTVFYVDGTLVQDGSPLDLGILPGSTNYPTTQIDRIFIGGSRTDMLNGYLRKIAYWPFLLSSTELLNLTKADGTAGAIIL